MSAETNRRLRSVCTRFEKVDSPCVVNYTLKKTAIDQKAKYNYDIIDAVHKNFYVDHYLGS